MSRSRDQARVTQSAGGGTVLRLLSLDMRLRVPAGPRTAAEAMVRELRSDAPLASARQPLRKAIQVGRGGLWAPILNFQEVPEIIIELIDRPTVRTDAAPQSSATPPRHVDRQDGDGADQPVTAGAAAPFPAALCGADHLALTGVLYSGCAMSPLWRRTFSPARPGGAFSLWSAARVATSSRSRQPYSHNKDHDNNHEGDNSPLTDRG